MHKKVGLLLQLITNDNVSKRFLHTQGECTFLSELLLNTNHVGSGQLIGFAMVWILLDSDTAATICIERVQCMVATWMSN